MLSSLANLLPIRSPTTPFQQRPQQPESPLHDDSNRVSIINDVRGEPTANAQNPPHSRPRPASQSTLPTPVLSSANETFIMVRPPPAKSNHPLNLQVQLVPPSLRSRQNRTSTESLALARSRSDASTTSTATSGPGTSTSSVASTASSTASGRRTIIPLYNLQAHNVLTNIIVDAGTDAKIAKFQRRGIELIDLCFLEPVEFLADPSPQQLLAVPNPGNRSSFVGPASTRTSTSTNMDERSSPSVVIVPPTNPAASPANKRNLFNKIFSKRGVKDPQGQQQQQLQPTHNPAYYGSTSTHTDSTTSLTSSSMASFVHSHDYAQDIGLGGGITPTPRSPGMNQDQAQGTDDNQTQHMDQIDQEGVKTEVGSEPSSLDSAAHRRQSETPRTPTIHTRTPRTPRQEDSLQPQLQDQSQTPRGLSLSGMRTTLRNNRNRISAAVSGAIGGERGPSAERDKNIGNSERHVVDLDVDVRDRTVGEDGKMRKGVRGSVDAITNGITKRGSLTFRTSNSLQNQPPHPSNGTPTTTTNLVAPQAVTTKAEKPTLRPPTLGIQPTLAVGPAYVAAGLFPGLTSGTGTGTSTSLGANGVPDSVTSSANAPPGAAIPPGTGIGTTPSSENVDLAHARAIMYAWYVRRWTKRNSGPAGVFGNVFSGSNAHDGQLGVPGLGGVEVSVEWKRARGSRRRRGEKEKEREKLRENNGEKDQSQESVGREDSGKRSDKSKRPLSRDIDGEGEGRRSGEGRPVDKVKERERRHRSNSRKRASKSLEEDGSGRSNSHDSQDDGEESDPEDSETPWVCTLKLRALSAGIGNTKTSLGDAGVGRATGASLSTSNTTAGNPNPPALRIKVGTMSPTPHHPKVVAMLKVPFPLPDVEIARLGIVRRRGAGPGPVPQPSFGPSTPTPPTFSPPSPLETITTTTTTTLPASQLTGHSVTSSLAAEPYSGALLTADEIKDVVCATGLWLAVREGFGGVGKVSRKGDGWRIRA